jgi:hypothetical protein
MRGLPEKYYKRRLNKAKGEWAYHVAIENDKKERQDIICNEDDLERYHPPNTNPVICSV